MIKVIKREKIPQKLLIIIPIISILVGLIIGAIAMIIVKINPLIVYKAIILGAFGSWYAFTETLVFTTPLILLSVGLIMAYKISFWNIGAFGQYILGAIFSSYFALFGPQNLSRLITLTIMVLLGLLGGAFWAAIPAFLKTYWDVNEVLSTLLLNYIALNILRYLMYGTWKDPSHIGFPLSRRFEVNAQLPRIIPNSRVNLGLLFGIIAALLIWFILKKTKFGYRISVIGGNPIAAKYAGINVINDTIICIMISGALSGLAGMVQVSGVLHLLQIEINPYYGYTAIIIAWLANLNPIVSIFVSYFFGAMISGAYLIQLTMKVPIGISSLIQSSIFFVLIGSRFLINYKVVFEKRSKK
ncbi:MAG: ABC transporter permease [Caldisericia bacterium]|jgi:simple sugar transport system permease protein|nr:ABC transporter permease [Caldisericia bacterium]